MNLYRRSMNANEKLVKEFLLATMVEEEMEDVLVEITGLIVEVLAMTMDAVMTMVDVILVDLIHLATIMDEVDMTPRVDETTIVDLDHPMVIPIVHDPDLVKEEDQEEVVRTMIVDPMILEVIVVAVTVEDVALVVEEDMTRTVEVAMSVEMEATVEVMIDAD
jgi:hypothetical protein